MGYGDFRSNTVYDEKKGKFDRCVASGGSADMFVRARYMAMREISSTHTSWEVWEKEIWPPSSPYANPFDYFARGVSELRVRASPPTRPET
jgi:hypothetical protein